MDFSNEPLGLTAAASEGHSSSASPSVRGRASRVGSQAHSGAELSAHYTSARQGDPWARAWGHGSTPVRNAVFAPPPAKSTRVCILTGAMEGLEKHWAGSTRDGPGP